MANHEYIINCRSFNVKTITNELNDIAKTVLKDLFVVKYEDEWWSVYFKEDESISFELWLDYTVHTGTRKKRCIEARHKPGEFEWWLDIQITGHLCERLSGKMMDDGIDKIFDPNPNKYPTVTTWEKRMWKGLDLEATTFLTKCLSKPPHKALKVFYD